MVEEGRGKKKKQLGERGETNSQREAEVGGRREEKRQTWRKNSGWAEGRRKSRGRKESEYKGKKRHVKSASVVGN